MLRNIRLQLWLGVGLGTLALAAGCQGGEATPILTQAEATNAAYAFAATRSAPNWGWVMSEEHLLRLSQYSGDSSNLARACFGVPPQTSTGISANRELRHVADARFEPSRAKWIISTRADGCTFVVDDRTGVVAWPS